MTAAKVSAPFAAPCVTLGTASQGSLKFSLAPLRTGDCAGLGEAFARMDPWLQYPYEAELLAGYFAEHEVGAPRYALMAGQHLAGAVGLRLNWLRGPYVQFLGVLQPYQGQGAGGLVLNWLDAETRRAGERNAWVCASDFNTEGLRFYERHGYARVAVLQGLVREGRNEVLLRKLIGP